MSGDDDSDGGYGGYGDDDDEESTAVVLDNGSGQMKAGPAGAHTEFLNGLFEIGGGDGDGTTTYLTIKPSQQPVVSCTIAVMIILLMIITIGNLVKCVRTMRRKK